MAGHGRTAFQCFEKYQSESVMENLRRKKWTEEEDNRLKQIVDSCRVGNYISWDQVGYLFEGRTRMQCQLRYTRVLDSNLRKGRWSEEEDLLLIAGVKKYGPKDWYKVAEFVKGRTDTQCRERWVGCLDAGLKMGVWTKEEDKKLMYGVRMFGVGSWAKISRLIDGRTPSACKIRHKTLTHTRKHYPRVREAAEVKLTKKGEPMKKRGPKGRSDKTIPFEVRLERCTALIEKSRSRKQNLMRIFNELGCEMPQSVHKTPTEFLDSDVPANVRAAFKQKLAEIHAKYGDFEREIIEAKQKEITSRANSVSVKFSQNLAVFLISLFHLSLLVGALVQVKLLLTAK